MGDQAEGYSFSTWPLWVEQAHRINIFSPASQLMRCLRHDLDREAAGGPRPQPTAHGSRRLEIGSSW